MNGKKLKRDFGNSIDFFQKIKFCGVKTASKHFHRKFTMTELLIVIAIIAGICIGVFVKNFPLLEFEKKSIYT